MKRPLLASLLTATLAIPAFADEDKAGPTDNRPPEGFTALFNGKDLTNWKGVIPLGQRAKLSGEELEKRQQGETLELLDPASLPETPTEPKRLVIVGAGTIVGMVLGALFAGAKEARDSSLKNLKDVRAYTQLPVLGSVPLLENDLVVRRRKRLGWLAWSTACLVGILIMTGSVFYYYATRV